MASDGYVPAEESLGKVYDARLIKRVSSYARPYIWYLALALVLAALLSGVEIILPYLTKIGIDNYIVIRSKRIEMANLEEPFQRELLESYPIETGKSYRLKSSGKEEIVLKEGILDPEHRKKLVDRNALNPQEYYIIDLNKYEPETRDLIDRISADPANNIIPTTNPDIYIIDNKDLAALDSDLRDVIRGPDWSGISIISGTYLGILLAAFLIMFGQVYIMAWVGQKIMFDIRVELFEHIERLPLKFFNTQPTGRLVTRVSNDVNVLNEMFTSILVEVFKNILKLIGIVIVMLLLAPHLAFATFVLMPVIISVTWIFKQKMRDAFRMVRAKIALINSILSEHLSGMKVIQMFGRQKIHFNRFQKVNHECYEANMHQLIVQSMFSPFIVFLENLGIALILYYGGGLVIRDTVSLGVLVAFLSYLSMFFGPVRDIAEKFNIMQAAMASSERIFQIMDKEREDARETSSPSLESTAIKGEISFENVWFAYNDEDWVLRNVSFHICPGETIAFVGATGSGKTTIVNLLSKFYTIQKGSIKIDGRDISDFSREYLRRRMAVVLQDVFLFSGDLRHNIRLNEMSITDEDIQRASEIVHANHFINKFKDGYNHYLEEGGATLSQGQRQLLAFARALAFNPAILVLDEATANIDSETEQLIQKALDKLLESRTAVVVAHRLSTIKKADKIIVMHRGKIREIGDHKTLLARRGVYYRLYQLQYKNQESIIGPHRSPKIPD
ncbi:ABC transporter ATP-binding protein [bacterium]|nr:ABC transporter ATP-binding protein [candidate division CSSED10-310 bacterium]